MEIRGLLSIALLSCLLISCGEKSDESGPPLHNRATERRMFMAKGVVKELKADRRTVIIRHESISNYMAAMTMPFRVREPSELAGLQPGDSISFCIQVTDSESWIEQISKTGTSPPDVVRATDQQGGEIRSPHGQHPLLDYKFTNELGQAVSLNQFQGQALAVTFFFTRCPLPEYCPRLSQNFQEASRKLNSMTGAPTNWHFLSVSFDTEFDTPSVLKAYAAKYQYDPNHWSFLTGPSDKISELARLCDVSFEREGGFYNHNFRTLIIDAAGDLQMAFPVGGNISDGIVEEILKAAAVRHR